MRAHTHTYTHTNTRTRTHTETQTQHPLVIDRTAFAPTLCRAAAIKYSRT